MKKAAERRLIALLLPLPFLAAGALYVKLGHPVRTIEVALTFPQLCIWFLGLRSLPLAGAVGIGYWYLLGALFGHALLCGRDRLGKALFICVLATSAVVALTLLTLRGFG